ncbi:MAG TPA: acyl carrier protein [Rhodopila sp.]
MTGPVVKITAILRDVLLDPSLECTTATRFEDITGWDSMDLVTAVVEVECRFGLQFELAEIDRLVTVRDLLNMIAAKQALLAA